MGCRMGVLYSAYSIKLHHLITGLLLDLENCNFHQNFGKFFVIHVLSGGVILAGQD